MVPYAPSSDRQPNGRSGAANGHGRAERIPGTPRKEARVVREKAVQVPELKDYVRSLSLSPEGLATLADTGIGSWRLSRKGCFRVSLQGSEFGDGRGRSYQADQAWGPSEKRAADDRGIRAPTIMEFGADEGI
jgi:hypothetical protein